MSGSSLLEFLDGSRLSQLMTNGFMRTSKTVINYIIELNVGDQHANIENIPNALLELLQILPWTASGIL